MNSDLLNQKPLVDSFLNQSPRPLSGFSFVSLFAWESFFEYELKTIDGALCIFAHGQSGCFLYLPPLGKKLNSSTIEEVFKHMAGQGKPKAVNRIENIPEYLLPFFKDLKYNQYSKPVEYVYRKASLISLQGNAYKSQRHDCNHLKAHQADCSFEIYSPSDLDQCLKLYERWAQDRKAAYRDEIYCSMLDENRQVHERLLQNAKSLGLVVRLLKMDNKLAGYTFGFGLDQETFCVYAEIADLEITGTAAYMFRAFCADRDLEKYSRINTMDDFAMPNVARAKQAYHPSELIRSYTISLKN